MSNFLPPPPPSLLADRELYLWLTQIYRLINGTDSGFVLSMDSSNGTAARASAQASSAAAAADQAPLLTPPVAQVRQDVIPDLVKPQVSQSDLQSAQLSAMCGQIAALQSQLDAVLLMQQPSIVPRGFSAIRVSAAHYVKPGEFVDVDASGGAVTVTLPSAASNVGKLCGVAKSDSSANNVTVSGAINGAASATITVQYTALLFISVGTEWRLW